MSLYVAAYDITEDRRRVQIARILTNYGRRVQQSVFEVWLKPKQVGALKHRLAAILGKDDRFDLFPVDERGPRRRVGWLRSPICYATVSVVIPRDEGGLPVAGVKRFRVEDIPERNRGLPLHRRIRYWKDGKCSDTPTPSIPPESAGKAEPG